jgi:hypothetical protein
MSKEPVCKHGLTQFYIEGEGFTPSTMPSPRLRVMAPAAIAATEDTPQVEEEERACRFCRLFPALKHFGPATPD